jgi:hypothetical protein
MRMRRAVAATPGRRIGVHDRNQFELKLEYEPATDSPETRYTVEAFLCVPGSLNLEPETMPPQALYGEIHNYVRLKTPEISWAALGGLPDSPLVRAEAEVNRGAAVDVGALAYQCRMFASVFRGNLRDLLDAVEARIRGDGGEERFAAAMELVSDAIDGFRPSLERFRKLREQVERGAIPERGRAAWRLADEYTSVSIEQLFRRGIVAVDRAQRSAAGTRPGAPLMDRLFAEILAEEKYRRERGYPSILDPQTDNEGYLYRAGLLKKYCSSALFLRIHREQPRRPWQEILFAVAAGIAMAFATVIAFWAQTAYPTVGLQFFLILVVAYMFKDRLKEGTRALFSRWLERHVYDRKIVIDDPAGGRLGLCREKIEYVPQERLPADIRIARERGEDPALRIAEAELRESIIRYRKEIVLDSRRLRDRPGGGGVTDILRFHVARLLHHMDEPDQEIEWVDFETRRLDPIRAAKVYHVDVVFRFQGGGRQVATTLMRLILDRRGIKRIDTNG